MKLSGKAIEAIKQKRLRSMLCLALNRTDRGITDCCLKNKPNNGLTTEQALSVIRAETGMSNDEILEDELVGLDK